MHCCTGGFKGAHNCTSRILRGSSISGSRTWKLIIGRNLLWSSHVDTNEQPSIYLHCLTIADDPSLTKRINKLIVTINHNRKYAGTSNLISETCLKVTNRRSELCVFYYISLELYQVFRKKDLIFMLMATEVLFTESVVVVVSKQHKVLEKQPWFPVLRPLCGHYVWNFYYDEAYNHPWS